MASLQLGAYKEGRAQGRQDAKKEIDNLTDMLYRALSYIEYTSEVNMESFDDDIVDWWKHNKDKK